MKPQQGKARIRLLQLLIAGSLLLLLLFLGYWLNSRYKNEQEALLKDLTGRLEASQQEVSDSLVMIKVVIPALSMDTFTGNRTLSANSSHLQVSMVTTEDTFTSFPFPGSGGQKPHKISRKFTYRSTNDTSATLLPRGFGSVLRKSGVLGDSLQHLLLGTDTAVIKAAFKKKLAKGGYNFSTQLVSRSAKHTHHSNAIILPVSNSRSMFVTGFRPYILHQIVPDILFAIFLLGFTSIAFGLTIRSLRQQIRLSLIRNELVSNMSHELKTPVATVKVALEALGDDEVLQNTSTVREYVGIASLELARLEMMINQALHTSLLEEGQLLIQLHPVDIRQPIKQVLHAMDMRFRQQGVTLLSAYHGDHFIARADDLHFQGVLLNVLDNALKYGSDKGTVQVLVTALSDSLIISVTDDGPGIPEEYHRHVFDKFFRVPAYNLHSVKGYGLGLSYAYRVMQQHGGSISVKNNDGARGCTFTITLPSANLHEA